MPVPGLEALLLGGAAYLLGSVQFSRLVGARKGVDLQRTGSGVASAANVWHTLGLLPAAVAIVVDIGKAALPVAGVHAMRGPESAAYVGVWVMIGHNWPVFFGFNGGRGLLVALAAAGILAPRELGLLAIALLPIAFVIRDTAPPAGAAALLLPVLALLFGEPPGVVVAFVAVAVIVFVRRATAPPRGPTTRRGLASRLVFDRPERRRRWALDS